MAVVITGATKFVADLSTDFSGRETLATVEATSLEINSSCPRVVAPEKAQIARENKAIKDLFFMLWVYLMGAVLLPRARSLSSFFRSTGINDFLSSKTLRQ